MAQVIKQFLTVSPCPIQKTKENKSCSETTGNHSLFHVLTKSNVNFTHRHQKCKNVTNSNDISEYQRSLTIHKSQQHFTNLFMS